MDSSSIIRFFIPLDVYHRLFGEEMVCGEGCYKIDGETRDGAMPGVLNLSPDIHQGIMKALLTPPNVISLSRGIAAIAMLFFPVFSMPFWILYCWGGFSDMIDGPIARKMKMTSELGSRIDSISDLLFLVCSAIVLFPFISLPIWIWIWVTAIGVIKAEFIIIKSYRSRIPDVPHSMMNKMTGFLLFCLPFSIKTTGIFISSIIVCTVASVGVLTDIISLQNQRNVESFTKNNYGI